MANTRKGLGRGLSALLGDDRPIIEDQQEVAAVGDASGSPTGRRRLPIEFLVRNSNQPRYHFDEEAIDELAASIRDRGLLQPILVREQSAEAYQIVAGERRWRAAQKAGIHEVPVVVLDLTDTEVLEVAIVENIQRQDLTAIEEATAYQRLIEEFGHTQDAVSKIVGKSRSHITNLLRLLNLPQKVRDLVDAGEISMGHARALITTDNPVALAQKVIADGLSVRQTEAAAKQTDTGTGPRREPRPGGHGTRSQSKDADTVALEKDLTVALGSKVSIDHQGEGGVVTITYKSLEELDELCSKFGVCGF
jgi:ParB family chromosome partitioning protein